MSGCQTGLGRDLTKYPTPLIIIDVRLLFDHLGGWGTFMGSKARQEESSMRVHVFKGPHHEVALLIEPSRGKHQVPVFLPVMTKEEAKKAVEAAVAEMRGDHIG